MARRLKDMNIEAIALVEAGAVRKKFYIKKEKIMDLIEVLKPLLGEDTTLTDEEIAKVGSLGEENSKGIEDALNIFKDYDDVLPPELKKALIALVKSACYGFPVEETKEVDVLAGLLDVEKAKGWLDKGTSAKLKKIIATLQSMVTEKEDTFKKTTKVEDPSKLTPEVLAQLEELQVFKDKAAAAAQADKDKVITDILATQKKQTELLEKIAKGEPITKQIEGEPDPKDVKKDKTVMLTKAEYEKLDKEGRRLAEKEGRYDAFASFAVVSS